MSARRPKNLAEALEKAPRFSVTLLPTFVAELVGMEVLGAEVWGEYRLRKELLRQVSTADRYLRVRDEFGRWTNLGPSANLTAKRQYATWHRQRARWALRLGLTVDQAVELVPEEDREEARMLVAEAQDDARAFLRIKAELEAVRHPRAGAAS